MTYGQLDERVQELAAGIRSALTTLSTDGVDDQQRADVLGPLGAVAVLAEGTDAVCAMLAVLRSGAAYVAINPRMPEGEMRALTSCARLLLGRGSTGDSSLGPIRDLDEVAAEGRATPSATVNGHNRGHEQALTHDQIPAWIAYGTGGSRHVVVGHGALAHSVAARMAAYGTPDRVLLPPLLAPQWLGTVLWTLAAGATVVLGPTTSGKRFGPGGSNSAAGNAATGGLPERDWALATATLISQAGVTDVVCPASLWPLVQPRADLEQLASVRRVMLSGDVWGEDTVTWHVTATHYAELFSEFGPAEAAGWVSHALIYSPLTDRQPITIGRPAEHVAVYLVPAAGQDQSLGDSRPEEPPREGELCVAGPHQALGFLGSSPDAVEERWADVADDICAIRTGESAALSPSGDFALTGSVDQQLVVRGHRVDPLVIETAILSHGGPVGLAHVTTYPHRSDAGRVDLVAYITVPQPETSLDTSAVSEAMAAAGLPLFMLPAAWAVMTEFPRTADGRIDRDAFPAPFGLTDRLAADPAPTIAPTDPPMTAIESVVAQVWGDVLKVAQVDRGDRWSALGGEERDAMRAVRLLDDRGLQVTPARLLSADSVSGVAANLQVQATAAPPPPRPGETTIVPTAAHRWFREQHFAAADKLTRARLFATDYDTTAEQLGEAVTRVWARHEVFRTRFEPSHLGGWTGKLLAEPPTVHLAEFAANLPDDSVDAPQEFRLLSEHNEVSIADGVLWRVSTYIDYVHKRRWLHVVLHWLIADEWSWDVITGDLAAELREPGTLPEIAPAMITRPARPADSQLARWRKLTTCRLPALARETAGRVSRAPYGEWLQGEESLSTRATRALQTFTRQRPSVTMTDILLAALYRALQPITAHLPGLYVSLTADGRSESPHAGTLVGALASWYPALLKDTTAETAVTGPPADEARASLASVADDFHQQLAKLPSDRAAFAVARYLDGDRSLQDVPIPPVSFTYLGRRMPVDGPLRAVPTPTEQVIGAENVLRTMLEITAEIIDGQVSVRFASDPWRIGEHELARVRTVMRDELEMFACLQPITRGPTASTRRVFAVHGADGETSGYRALAESLGDRADCFGLRALPASVSAGDDAVASLAKRYVQYLRRLQPTGPYELVGAGPTAPMAFAMAKWLEAENQPTHLILLAPASPHRSHDETGVSSLVIDLRTVADLEPRRAHDLASRALAIPAEARTCWLVEQIAGSDNALADRVRTLLELRALLAGWRPEAGPVGKLTVVHPDDHGGRAAAAGWAELGHQVSTVPVACDHRAILTDKGALATVTDLVAALPTPFFDAPATVRPPI